MLFLFPPGETMATTNAALALNPSGEGNMSTTVRGAVVGPDVAKGPTENKLAAANTSDPLHRWVEFFGPPRYRMPQDTNSQWSRETLSLPEVYNGTNNYLTIFLIEEMTTRNRVDFFRYVLPVRDVGFETRFTFSRITFDSTIMPNMPEQSVSRLVSMSREQVTGALVRKGLALMLEHGFMRSPEGRKSYTMQMRQIRNAAVDSLLYTAISELLQKNIPHQKWLELYGTSASPSGLTMDAIEEVERFAILNKNPNGWDLIDASAKNKMSLNNREPDVWLIPVGLMSMIATLRGQAYHSRGENDLMVAHRQGMDALAREFNRRNNCTLFEVKTFTIPGAARPVQLLERTKTIGEYFTMNPTTDKNFLSSGRYSTDARTIYIYDESKDDEVPVRILDAIAATGRFGPSNNGFPSREDGNPRSFNSGKRDSSGNLMLEDDMFGSLEQSWLIHRSAEVPSELSFRGAVFGHLKQSVISKTCIADVVDSMVGSMVRIHGEGMVFDMRKDIQSVQAFIKSLAFAKETELVEYLAGLKIDGATGLPVPSEVLKKSAPKGFGSYHGFKTLLQVADTSDNFTAHDRSMCEAAIRVTHVFSEFVRSFISDNVERNIFLESATVNPFLVHKDSPVQKSARAGDADRIHDVVFQMLFNRARPGSEGNYFVFYKSDKSAPSIGADKKVKILSGSAFETDKEINLEDVSDKIKTFVETIVKNKLFPEENSKNVASNKRAVEKLQKSATEKIQTLLLPFVQYESDADGGLQVERYPLLLQYLQAISKVLNLSDDMYTLANFSSISKDVIPSLFDDLNFAMDVNTTISKVNEGRNPFAILNRMLDTTHDAEFFKALKGGEELREVNNPENAVMKSILKKMVVAVSDLKGAAAPVAPGTAVPSLILASALVVNTPGALPSTSSVPDMFLVGGARVPELFLEGVKRFFASIQEKTSNTDIFNVGTKGKQESHALDHPFADETFLIQDKICEQLFATSDPVRHMFARLFIGQKLDFQSLEEFGNLNVAIPFSVLLYRPFQTYRMQSAICMKAGKDTGEVLTSDANMSLGDDPMRHIHVGSFTVRFGCMIAQPENVYIAEDIVCTGYLGGGGSKLFTSPNEFRQYAPTFTGASIFARLLPYDYTDIPTAIHLADDKLAALEATSLPGRDWFQRYWQLPSASSGGMPFAFGERNSMVNTLCFRGHQLSYDTATERHTKVTQNTGHWGPNVYPGCSRQRTSLGGVLQPVAGRSPGPVTLTGF